MKKVLRNAVFPDFTNQDTNTKSAVSNSDPNKVKICHVIKVEVCLS
jgi:hypothetical protein